MRWIFALALLVAPLMADAVLRLRGANGREAEFSGVRIATRNGLVARAMDGREVEIDWRFIDPGMYIWDSSPLKQAYDFAQTHGIAYLAWGWFAGDSNEAISMEDIIQCSTHEYALIVPDLFIGPARRAALVLYSPGIRGVNLAGEDNPFGTPAGAQNPGRLFLRHHLDSLGYLGETLLTIRFSNFLAEFIVRESDREHFVDGEYLLILQGRGERPIITIDSLNPFRGNANLLLFSEDDFDLRLAAIIESMSYTYETKHDSTEYRLKFSAPMRDAMVRFARFMESEGRGLQTANSELFLNPPTDSPRYTGRR